MDTTTAAVIIVLALIVFAALMLSSNVRARIKGLFGLEAELDASKNPPAPGKPHDIEITDAKAGDDILAENEGEGGIGISRVETKGGIVATNKKSTDDPKANPPA